MVYCNENGDSKYLTMEVKKVNFVSDEDKLLSKGLRC